MYGRTVLMMLVGQTGSVCLVGPVGLLDPVCQVGPTR